jgi:hypothetical protein
MNRFQYALCFFFVFPLILCAQTGIPSYQYKVKARIRYVSEPVGFEKNSNRVIREIGKENLVDPFNVKIYLYANMHILISPAADGNNSVRIFLKQMVPGGLTRYRRFDISDVLLPDSLKISVSYRNKSDSNQSTTFNFPLDLPVAGDQPAITFQLPEFDPSTDTLIPGIEGIIFNEDGLTRFLDRVQLINDYYASSMLLDSLDKQISAIDADSAALLPGNLFRIEGVAKAVRLIASRNFDSTLIAGGDDPANLWSRLRDVDRRSRSLVYTYNETLDNTGVIPWDKDAAGAANALVNGLMKYIIMSSRMNDLNGALFQEYLRTYFTSNVFEPVDEFRKLTSHMYPGVSPDAASVFMADTIFRAFVLKIETLTGNDEYAEAFDLLNVLGSFAETYQGTFTRSTVDSLESVAATGVFSSYLGIAQSCIEQGKFLMAENYMGRALEYRREYPLWIPSDSLYGRVFRQLFTRRLESCDAMLGQGRFRDAIDCYKTFEKSFNPGEIALVKVQLDQKVDSARRSLLEELVKSSFLAYSHKDPDSALWFYEEAMQVNSDIITGGDRGNLPDSLTALILPIKFDEFVSAGRMALQRRNYGEAYHALSLADTISKRIGLQTDSLYNADLLSATRYHFLDEISLHTGYIWNNRFDSAYAWAAEVTREAEISGLANDSILTAAVNGYISKIGKRRCSNNHEAAELLWIRATRNLEGGRYIIAFNQADSARMIINQNPDCKIRVPGISDSLWKYQPAYNYQVLMDSLKDNVAVGNYSVAISLMLNAERDWVKNRLSGFGFDTFRMYDFVRSRGNISLTLTALNYYLGHAAPDEAFRYLYLLEIGGYQAKEARQIQSDLGTRFAETDFRTDPGYDPVTRLQELCGTDDWYNAFRKAYLEEWKKQKTK